MFKAEDLISSFIESNGSIRVTLHKTREIKVLNSKSSGTVIFGASGDPNRLKVLVKIKRGDLKGYTLGGSDLLLKLNKSYNFKVKNAFSDLTNIIADLQIT